jgi:histidinol-phosphate/aromatic aminotransferase/cobyric acid decarboxylase-like protein
VTETLPAQSSAPLRAIPTVYSYYLPEIRELITGLTREYPHEVFLRSIAPGLDDFHQPIFEKLIAAHRHDVPDLGQFAFRYPTAGSEEGIREYLTLLRAQGVDQIYTWRGDYEGYREVAKTRGIATVEVDFEADPRTLARGHWFLSNPSARNGMIVPADRILAIAEAGHQIFYDLSYLGATDFHLFDVRHPNVAAVAISFSKPFGLFYYRVGFTFSREAIPALFANKWFKNVYGLLIAERILETVDQRALTQTYKRVQAAIVREINDELGLGASASDVFLLASLPAAAGTALPCERQEQIAKFARGAWYRFCLTPYFEQREGREAL